MIQIDSRHFVTLLDKDCNRVFFHSFGTNCRVFFAAPVSGGFLWCIWTFWCVPLSLVLHQMHQSHSHILPNKSQIRQQGCANLKAAKDPEYRSIMFSFNFLWILKIALFISDSLTERLTLNFFTFSLITAFQICPNWPNKTHETMMTRANQSRKKFENKIWIPIFS